MKNKDKIIIEKIIIYINDIKEYVKDIEAIDFLNDKKTITASAFTVSQIGELTKKLSTEIITEYKDIPWNSMKGMRNRIIHDYENVNLTVLWKTIKESLPELKEKLNDILMNKNK